MIITLDANILIRAVLGTRVYRILKAYPNFGFYVPDRMVKEAQTELPRILQKRGGDADFELAFMDDLLRTIQMIEYAV